MGAASYMPAQYEIYGQERLYFVSDRRHVACSTPERFVGSFESVMWFFPGNGTCRNIWKIKAKGFIFFFFVLLTMPPWSANQPPYNSCFVYNIEVMKMLRENATSAKKSVWRDL